MYTIYSKPNCSYCAWAKDLLTSQGEQYTEFDITIEENYNVLVERLGFQPKTVPQIWVDDRFIGGYDQLVEHLGM